MEILNSDGYIGKIQFFFFKLLPKFSCVINYDDCIGKITSKSLQPYPVFIKKYI